MFSVPPKTPKSSFRRVRPSVPLRLLVAKLTRSLDYSMARGPLHPSASTKQTSLSNKYPTTPPSQPTSSGTILRIRRARQKKELDLLAITRRKRVLAVRMGYTCRWPLSLLMRYLGGGIIVKQIGHAVLTITLPSGEEEVRTPDSLTP
jgi:hypothetical protein